MKFLTRIQLKRDALNHLSKIKDDTTLFKINQVLDPLRIYLDGKDPKFINDKQDKKREKYKNNYRMLCEINIKDILDVLPVRYNEEDSHKISQTFNEIMKINDRTFWEKFLSVLLGS